MVVALGPGKFYGSSLPRPRIYTDVKFSDERVDPPVPVTDPLMSWAEEAHWSMGGLSFKRHRLQGRIEGSIKKLRAERERLFKKRERVAANRVDPEDESGSGSPSPPAAPIVAKRRRFAALIDEEEEEEEDNEESKEYESKTRSVGVKLKPKRKFARKLGDDFNRVAMESGLGKNLSDGSEAVSSRTRSRRSGEGIDETKAVEDVKKSKPRGKKSKDDQEDKWAGEDAASTPARATRSSPIAATRSSPRLAKTGSS